MAESVRVRQLTEGEAKWTLRTQQRVGIAFLVLSTFWFVDVTLFLITFAAAANSHTAAAIAGPAVTASVQYAIPFFFASLLFLSAAIATGGIVWAFYKSFLVQDTGIPRRTRLVVWSMFFPQSVYNDFFVTAKPALQPVYEYVLASTICSGLAFSTCMLLPWRLEGSLELSWSLVYAPLFGSCVVMAVLLSYYARQMVAQGPADEFTKMAQFLPQLGDKARCVLFGFLLQAVCTMWFLVLFLFAVMLKLDGQSSASWKTIFTPLWLIDFLVPSFGPLIALALLNRSGFSISEIEYPYRVWYLPLIVTPFFAICHGMFAHWLEQSPMHRLSMARVLGAVFFVITVVILLWIAVLIAFFQTDDEPQDTPPVPPIVKISSQQPSEPARMTTDEQPS